MRRLQRESPQSPFLFVSERGAPFTPAGFAKMVERAGIAAKLEFKAHPHSCVTPAVMHWPMPATTLGRCRPISATATSSTRSATPSLRRPGSRTSGGSAVGAALSPMTPMPYDRDLTRPKGNTRGRAALRRPRSGSFSVNESNPAADHEGIGSRRVNFRRRADWMDAFFVFPILRDRCPFDS